MLRPEVIDDQQRVTCRLLRVILRGLAEKKRERYRALFDSSPEKSAPFLALVQTAGVTGVELDYPRRERAIRDAERPGDLGARQFLTPQQMNRFTADLLRIAMRSDRGLLRESSP